MIIQSETQLSVVRKLEKIAEREEAKADKFIATALKTANEEGRSDILNAEKTEYSFLCEKSEFLADILNEIKSDLNS